jgi:flavin reductase (DIM6/NTAB) family NADH-FMN oxidoreductase RutF
MNALAAFDCEAEAFLDHHSHAIVIGRVKAVRVAEHGSALLYWRGRYAEAGEDELSPRHGGGASKAVEQRG